MSNALHLFTQSSRVVAVLTRPIQCNTILYPLENKMNTRPGYHCLLLNDSILYKVRVGGNINDTDSSLQYNHLSPKIN